LVFLFQKIDFTESRKGLFLESVFFSHPILLASENILFDKSDSKLYQYIYSSSQSNERFPNSLLCKRHITISVFRRITQRVYPETSLITS